MKEINLCVGIFGITVGVMAFSTGVLNWFGVLALISGGINIGNYLFGRDHL